MFPIKDLPVPIDFKACINERKLNLKELKTDPQERTVFFLFLELSITCIENLFDWMAAPLFRALKKVQACYNKNISRKVKR